MLFVYHVAVKAIFICTADEKDEKTSQIFFSSPQTLSLTVTRPCLECWQSFATSYLTDKNILRSDL